MRERIIVLASCTEISIFSEYEEEFSKLTSSYANAEVEQSYLLLRATHIVIILLVGH